MPRKKKSRNHKKRPNHHHKRKGNRRFHTNHDQASNTSTSIPDLSVKPNDTTAVGTKTDKDDLEHKTAIRYLKLSALCDFVNEEKPLVHPSNAVEIKQYMETCPSVALPNANTGMHVKPIFEALYSKMYPFLSTHMHFIVDSRFRDIFWDMLLCMGKDKFYDETHSLHVGLAVIDGVRQYGANSNSLNEFFEAMTNKEYFFNWCERIVQRYMYATAPLKIRKNREFGKHVFFCSNGECSNTEEVINGKVSKFLRCSACHEQGKMTVAYCSRQCQKKDWKFHKVWCAKKNSPEKDTFPAVEEFLNNLF